MKSQRIPRAVFSLFMFVELILGVIVPTDAVRAEDNASPAIASGDSIPVQSSMLNADGTLNLSHGVNGSLDVSGWDVTLDPSRGPKFSPAALQRNTWSSLTDNGINGSVYALAVIGNDLYVGGSFSQTFGNATTGLNNIAKYNALTNTWSALADNGLDGSYVTSLAVTGNDLYVGGSFTQTFGGMTTGLNNIAKYNMLTKTWFALTDNGLDNWVYALSILGNDLYVGGFFTQTSGNATTGLNHIAKYNAITDTWSALADNGLDITVWNAAVFALAVIGNDLYVGGNFTQTYGGATMGLNGIARYATLTNTWSALTDNGLDRGVDDFAVIGNDLYAGGGFYQTYGGATTGLNSIAKYNTITNTWSALTDSGLNVFAIALAVIGNDLYVGGEFTQTYGGATTGLNNIARYDTITNDWSALANNGLDGGVWALAIIGNNLYAGGQFTQTFDRSKTGLNGIARHNMTTLENIASSLPKTGFAPNKATSLASQPSRLAYSNLGPIWLEIPSQNIKTNIVGIPKSDNNWDVNWLGWDAGWLNGTAFPTWEGNSVITGHVTDSHGLPGPFANLKDLNYGEQIIVHLYDQQYIFEVRNKRLVRPETTNFAFEHLEDHPYMTLITCQDYDQQTDSYRFRRVIRAILVDIK